MLCVLAPASSALSAQEAHPAQPNVTRADTTLAQLLAKLHEKARSLETTSGMRSSFQTFTAAHHLSPDGIRYSDYVMARLLFALRLRASQRLQPCSELASFPDCSTYRTARSTLSGHP